MQSTFPHNLHWESAGEPHGLQPHANSYEPPKARARITHGKRGLRGTSCEQHYTYQELPPVLHQYGRNELKRKSGSSSGCFFSRDMAKRDSSYRSSGGHPSLGPQPHGGTAKNAQRARSWQGVFPAVDAEHTLYIAPAWNSAESRMGTRPPSGGSEHQDDLLRGALAPRHFLRGKKVDR